VQYENEGSQFYKLYEGLDNDQRAEKNEDGTLRFPEGSYEKQRRLAACCGEDADFSQEDQIKQAIEQFGAYLQLERDHYYPTGLALRGEIRGLMLGYFEAALLEKARVKELTNERVAKAAVTFLDVVVFNEKFAIRDLFHGLVQAVQVEVIGLREYADLFVRRFLQSRSYFLVPLNAHAFSLDAKFASNPDKGFSVEEEVRRWWREGRY